MKHYERKKRKVKSRQIKERKKDRSRVGRKERRKDQEKERKDVNKRRNERKVKRTQRKDDRKKTTQWLRQLLIFTLAPKPGFQYVWFRVLDFKRADSPHLDDREQSLLISPQPQALLNKMCAIFIVIEIITYSPLVIPIQINTVSLLPVSQNLVT